MASGQACRTFTGGTVEHGVERFVAEDLLSPAASLTVKRQQLRAVNVHWHDFYELVYVTSGEATHLVNGVPHHLAAGSAFMLTPADFHELRAISPEPLSCYNVVVDAVHFERSLGQGLLSSIEPTPWMVADMTGLEDDFARLYEESQYERPGTLSMRQALLDCILVEFGRGCMSQAPVIANHARTEDAGIRRAVSFVEHHFREPLTLAMVAAQAHLSPNYFSERFRQATGTPFQVFLQHRRLAFSRSLLASTSLAVTEVCQAAGFNSLSHFGRAYRNRYGESPTAFRQGGSAS